MSETTFSTLSPRRLVDEVKTPFAVPPPSPGRLRCRPGFPAIHLLQRVDAVTDLVDAALAPAQIDDATPLSVELGWFSAPAPVPVGTDNDERLREQALAAVAQIRSTLGLSESTVASFAGIARNTLASWRRNQRAPYPATVRRLFEIQSLIAAATALFGSPDATRHWFHSPGPDGRTRRQMLSEGTGALAAELRGALFRQPASTLPTGDELDDETDADAETGPYTSEAFSGPVTVEPPLP